MGPDNLHVSALRRVDFISSQNAFANYITHQNIIPNVLVIGKDIY